MLHASKRIRAWCHSANVSGAVRSHLSSTSTGRPRATKELRKAFVDYFARNQHLVLPSSNLVPRNDPSLLFTTAGMVQFKDYFLGSRTPPATTISTVQKCVRAGGKHNDLENVGYTARHQTFFEMLGNFSFGSYWKTDAIKLAWTFLTKELGLPEDRLSVTVLDGDEDTASIWRAAIGLPESRIRRCGPQDNFWAMGDVGPCGPCTEIFWDQGHEVDGERHLEIWNLVFMQYQRAPDGTLSDLPLKCIDTGMGLERLASVVQGKPTNWDSDGLASLCQAVERLVEKRTKAPFVKSRDNDIATRVIVDHLRACSMLIAEGLIPGFHSRQYVLRRLQRRAIRYGHKLGLKDPFLAELLPNVLDALGEAYPEIVSSQEHIKNVLTTEEKLFSTTISRALDALDHEFKVQANIDAKLIPGSTVWSLYSKYGFPVDLTELVAKERGWMIDHAGFEAHLKEAQELSRSRWKGSGDLVVPNEVMSWTAKPKFVGYVDTHVPEATVLAATSPDHLGEAWAVVDPCPFYAEGGGQVGDQGHLTLENGSTVQVIDTVSPYQGGIVVKIKYNDSVEASALTSGTKVSATVNRAARLDTQRNHTATHLLHAALRSILGPHVTQAGSLVESGRLRFDFTHNAPISTQQVEQIEDWVNAAIQTASPVHMSEMTYEAALEKKAMALFTEKYGGKELVRVVQVGDKSIELCGGTHASESSQLLCFKIVSHGAVGSGVRRIVAVTGPAAVVYLRKRSNMVDRLSSTIRTEPEYLQTKVEAVLDQVKSKEKELIALQSKFLEVVEGPTKQSEAGTSSSSSTLSSSNSSANGNSNFYMIYHGAHNGQPVQIHCYRIPQEVKLLRERCDRLRETEPDSIHVILSGERALVSCAKGDSGQILRGIIKMLPENMCKGGGGKTVADARVMVDMDALLIELRRALCGAQSTASR